MKYFISCKGQDLEEFDTKKEMFEEVENILKDGDYNLNNLTLIEGKEVNVDVEITVMEI